MPNSKPVILKRTNSDESGQETVSSSNSCITACDDDRTSSSPSSLFISNVIL
eukprot:gene10467-2597_t